MLKRLSDLLYIFMTIGPFLVGAEAAQSWATPADTGCVPYSRFSWDIPLIDSYNLPYGAWPSMQQATRISAGAYQTLHYALGHVVNPHAAGMSGFLSSLVFLGVDEIARYVPPFDIWTHEEYHRAVMGRYDFHGYDDIYNFEIGIGVTSVTHVKDADLMALKRDHPADLVRLEEAGIEGQMQMILYMEKSAFYDDVANFNQGTYLLSYLASYLYVASGSSTVGDRMSDDHVAGEEVEKNRDFDGHDFTSWVYDLYRPDESYAARGIHPSGVGIRRYRQFADLSSHEVRYLRAQRDMQLLNFLDPQIYGITSWPIVGGAWRMNSSIQHYLTSFGYTLNANLFLKNAEHSWFFTVLNYHNRAESLFGIDTQLLRMPLNVAGLSALSTRVSLWQQPAHQGFYDQDTRWGGLLSTTMFFAATKGISPYLELEGKTAGWVAGNPYLDALVAARVGVELWLF